jgi:hypothetical protein
VRLYIVSALATRLRASAGRAGAPWRALCLRARLGGRRAVKAVASVTLALVAPKQAWVRTTILSCFASSVRVVVGGWAMLLLFALLSSCTVTSFTSS